ncbi:D-ribose ABC transporter substrate-binding protein [Streptomyces daliensis]|uniref:D-ribose ABC transporter substrate-binding protein n=1 Tax=Streptomyces daliensis TaxID=299421 RepID=A0A8T4IRT5_9ACTN|nr:D-ribose ABC transporter substrate-binding protein [Streptomyces daliensis]
MSKRSSTSAAMIVAALALTSTACGSGSADSGGKESVKLGLAISTLNNPFFVEMKKGAESEAKAEGAQLNVQDAQDDASQQANQVQNFTSQNVKSIIINPVDSDAAGPSVKAAGNADIPVVAADRGVNGAKVKTTVASDNVEGGKLAAKALAEQLDGKGSILVLRGISGTSASRERGKGFEEGIKKYPGIKIAAKQPANFDRAKGLDVTTNLLQSNPDITGVFAENDEMALGAIKALGSRAGKSVKVVGFDGTPDGLKAVEKGTMTVTVAQQPDELGKMAVRNALRLAKGDSVDEVIKVPVKVVDEKNVDQFSS